MFRPLLPGLALMLLSTPLLAEPVVITQKPMHAWKSVLLLPYFDNDPHFDHGRDAVTRAIVEIYGDKDVAVTRIEDSEYARDWQEILNNINGIFVRGRHRLDVEAAALALTQLGRRLGPDHPYDAVLIPTLGYRFAKIEDFYAVWDGVKRKIRFKRRPGGQTIGWGIVTGVSLSLVAMDRGLTGKVSEGMGGLVLPFVYDWIDKTNEPLPPTEIFSDYGDVKGGVEVARENLIGNDGLEYRMRFVPEVLD